MMKKTIKKGLIEIDGEKASGSEWIVEGMEISLLENEENIPEPFEMKLEIVYEDEYLAVIVKPAGIVVSGNMYRTIVNAVQYNISKSNLDDALPWPRPIHRLDMQTSGLLIIAKSQLASVELGKQLENKTLKKRYRAILVGGVSERIEFKSEIDGHKSHSELIRVKTINSIKSGKLSLVDLYPHTGRTHQLRIHTSENGTPILGDKLYGDIENTKLHKGLFLSAVEITFNHPETKDLINLQIPQPSKFDSLLEREERMWEKKQLG
jgi:RluA family pseudouridine synthase